MPKIHQPPKKAKRKTSRQNQTTIHRAKAVSSSLKTTAKQHVTDLKPKTPQPSGTYHAIKIAMYPTTLLKRLATLFAALCLSASAYPLVFKYVVDDLSASGLIDFSGDLEITPDAEDDDVVIDIEIVSLTLTATGPVSIVIWDWKKLLPEFEKSGTTEIKTETIIKRIKVKTQKVDFKANVGTTNDSILAPGLDTNFQLIAPNLTGLSTGTIIGHWELVTPQPVPDSPLGIYSLLPISALLAASRLRRSR